MRKTITGIGIALFFSGVFLFVFMASQSYDNFIKCILEFTNLSVDKRQKLENCLSNRTFQTLKFLPLVISTLGIFIVCRSAILTQYLVKTLNWVKRVFLFLTSLPNEQKYKLIFIITISFANNLYNTLNMPIFYDEAWTYLNFTKKGVLGSISYYPAPNNHILHSVLTNLTYYLPFGQTTNLRLPNLIVSLFSSILFFYTFSKLLNRKIALILLPLYCFLFPVLYYSYLSRGYSLLLLSFIICFYSTIRLTTDTGKIKPYFKYYISLSIGAVLGFYTMPSFLYPYFTCISFIFLYWKIKRNYTNIFHLFLSGLIVSVTVLSLYAPVFIISGIDAVTHNRFVEPILRTEVFNNLIHHFNETCVFLTGIPLIYVLILILLSTFILFKNKQYSSIFILYIFLIAPFILLLHSVIPFPRTWVYMIIPLLFAIGSLLKLSLINENIPKGRATIFSMLLSSLLIYSFYGKITLKESFSYKSTEIANYLINNNANFIYVNHPLITTNLVYIFEENNMDINMKCSQNSIENEEIKVIKSCCDYLITTEHLDSEFDFVKKWEGNTYLSKNN